MANLGSKSNDYLWVHGQAIDASTAGTTSNINVLIRDANQHALFATGTDVPADDTARYAKGCLFINTSVVTGTSGLYHNTGTSAECKFTQI